MLGSKICIFSAVQGQVTLNGQPVSGAAIERHYDWAWGHETRIDIYTSNDQGVFQLPPVFRRMWLGAILPHQPVITQKILIKHNDKEYLGWACTKMEYTENSELGGIPIRLICPLEAGPTHKNGFYGICDLVK